MYELARPAVRDHGAQHDEDELAMLLDLLQGRFPLQSVLEIGCDQGGGLWLWGHVAKRVVAITLHTRTDGAFSAHGARVINASSRLHTSWTRASNLIGDDGANLVFIDGGHDYVTARSDIDLALHYHPHALIIVHDICRRAGLPDIETYLAWERVREQLPHVEVVRSRDHTPGYGIIWPS